jgi:glycine dehydrogenase
MDLPPPVTEAQALAELKAIAARNRVLKSFIGQGYHGTHTPGVILRNILENPAWYTAYTPYQAEISQGRLEALINFQTMVTDLTGLAIANCVDARRGHRRRRGDDLARRSVRAKSDTLIVAGDCHPQTIEVIRTRCRAAGPDRDRRAGAGAAGGARLLRRRGAVPGHHRLVHDWRRRRAGARGRPPSSSAPTCWR